MCLNTWTLCLIWDISKIACGVADRQNGYVPPSCRDFEAQFLSMQFKNMRSAKTKVVQRKIVVLHSGIRFGYYPFTLKNCDRD
jgi:hypothetical protein